MRLSPKDLCHAFAHATTATFVMVAQPLHCGSGIKLCVHSHHRIHGSDIMISDARSHPERHAEFSGQHPAAGLRSLSPSWGLRSESVSGLE
jgi:hypothetical protein